MGVIEDVAYISRGEVIVGPTEMSDQMRCIDQLLLRMYMQGCILEIHVVPKDVFKVYHVVVCLLGCIMKGSAGRYGTESVVTVSSWSAPW